MFSVQAICGVWWAIQYSAPVLVVSGQHVFLADECRLFHGESRKLQQPFVDDPSARRYARLHRLGQRRAQGENGHKKSRSEKLALCAIEGDAFASHQVPGATLKMLLPDLPKRPPACAPRT